MKEKRTNRFYVEPLAEADGKAVSVPDAGADPCPCLALG